MTGNHAATDDEKQQQHNLQKHPLGKIANTSSINQLNQQNERRKQKITKLCYLCTANTIFNDIELKNLSFLYEGVEDVPIPRFV